MSQSQVIPSINAPTFLEVQERIKKIEPFVQWCHIDVTDGIFSKYPTWNSPEDLPRLETSLNVEVHLMVAVPEKTIDQWLVPPVRRVIVHCEAMKDPDLIIQKCREAGTEIGFAIAPETAPEKFEPWFGKVDMVQTLGVHPGPSGQKVDWPLMLGKIRHIRERCKSCIIELDGGVNPETAKKAREAGANIFVAGAYIYNSQNIEESIKALYISCGR